MVLSDMAFVLEIDLTPNIFVGDDATQVQIPIGYDDETGVTYSLFVVIGPTAGGVIELSFCLLEDGEQQATIWDGRITARIIPAEARQLVLDELTSTIAAVVSMGRFPEVSLHAIGRNLPAKAMLKYRAIEHVFRRLGYVIQTQEYNGQWSWWFKRIDDADQGSGGTR